MPVEPMYPGVFIEEISRGGRSIEGVATSITAFAGWARRGTTKRAQRVASWAEYERRFGGLDARSWLGYAVRHFFDNGGRQAYIVRLRHPSKRIPLYPNKPVFEQALLPADRIGGLYHLDRITLINLLCVPGETNAATIRALQTFCFERRAFLITDCSPEANFETLKSDAAEISGDNATNSACYFPWLLAPDALASNAPRAFPPCGFVAGVYARIDSTRGVWKAPAGTEASLSSVVGNAMNHTLSSAEYDDLNQSGVNCIRTFPDKGTVLWGARTLISGAQQNTQWEYICVRRTALFIEESICRSLQWATFEPNDEALWTSIRMAVENFLHSLFRTGALQGARPQEAYFVKCGSQTTTQNEIDGGVCNILIGFAALKPAEFVLIRIQQMAKGNNT